MGLYMFHEPNTQEIQAYLILWLCLLILGYENVVRLKCTCIYFTQEQ